MNEPAAWTYGPVLARYWSPKIRAALAASIDPAEAARAAMHRGPAADEAARQAVSMAADPSAQRNLSAVLADLAADAYAAGTLAATQDLRQAGWRDPSAAPGFESLRQTARRGWAPGVHVEAARQAASIPASAGIARLTSGVRSAAAGVLDSAMRSAARALRRSWAGSSGTDEAQQAIRAVFSPARAYRVAITAVVGALSAAAIDTYQTNGAQLWDWLTNRGACPACLARQAAGPFRLTDPPPPLHPGCQCTSRPRTAAPGTIVASRGIAGIGGFPGAPESPTATAESVDPAAP